MKILALITARGGSKRLPGKNTRLLGGKPLLQWSVETAAGIPDICDILVSTDDPAIADIGRKAGALVPWLRPAHLATDTATSVDVCLHAIDWYETAVRRIDGLLLLQPTSPFRTRESIGNGIALFRANPHRAVIGVGPAQTHPMWCFRIEAGDLQPYVAGDGLHRRSQDLPPAYQINGAFYLIGPDALRRDRSFFRESPQPLIMDRPQENIDIDSELDWRVAEAMLGSTTQPG